MKILSGLTDENNTILLCAVTGFLVFLICSKIKKCHCECEGSSTVSLSNFSYGEPGGDVKMVFVIRNDLKMGKGKSAAQCSHAAITAYEIAAVKDPQLLKKWKTDGQRKIVVKVESEKELLKIIDDAKKAGLIYALVRDAGKTQVERGTKTVAAIGPGKETVINKITGHLKLY